MKPTTKMNTASVAICGQVAIYTELLSIAGKRCRIRIESDAVHAQSSARLEGWDGDRWQEVWSIPYGSMSTRQGLAYRAPANPPHVNDFAADRAGLVEAATAVLG